MEFRWIEWNVEKVRKHGVEPEEAEQAVCNARTPYPRKELDGRRLVRSKTDAGRFLQVAFIIDPDSTLFIIHARPLTEREKRSLRRESR